MIAFILQDIDQAFGVALNEIIAIAVRGGFLAWGIFMGWLLGTGFFDDEEPYKRKVILISMPVAVLLALFFAFWSLKGCVNPGETGAEALHDAQVTFFSVLIPLWAGCLLGIFRHPHSLSMFGEKDSTSDQDKE